MKFGTYFAYWEREWDADYASYCEKAAGLGFDVLEVAAGGLAQRTDAELFDIKRAAQENGVEITACIGLPPQYNTASADEGVRRAGVEYLKRIMDAMYKVDSHILGGIIYAYWPCDYNQPVDKERAREAAVRSMREAADTAESLDIVLAMETVNRFEQYIINSAEEAVEFVKEIGKENAKVMLDSFHMNIEEDGLGEAIRRTGNSLGHFHIGEGNRKVPGKGHMPWAEMGAALRKAGYDGAVVMEPFVKMGGTVGSDIKVWRDLSEGASVEQMDEDIREALRFVKKQFVE
ncbi:sugar phosphate isomerase/epimerase family protein [Christensenella minuta]|uniref:D-psicose 3-epimerase n=1 Tax=Christensenella minuta TaxID=626937 RepID=UPI00321F8A30